MLVQRREVVRISMDTHLHTQGLLAHEASIPTKRSWHMRYSMKLQRDVVTTKHV